MSIITEYPNWYILLCVVLGVGLGLFLYLKDRSNRHYPPILRGLLAFLRAITVSVLAFFLLNPLLKSLDKVTEKPIIVFAQDNSESLIIGKDSTYIKGEYQNALKEMIASLGDEYEVRTYSFGESLKEGIDDLTYSEKSTNFSNLLDEIYTKYSNRNLGALIIGTDGLYNQGINPRYSFKKLKVPIYTVALGDTIEKRDVLIKETQHNRLAYLGNRFPVKVFVDAKKSIGEEISMTVTRNGSVVFNQRIQITQENFQEEIDFTLAAKQVGLQRYQLSVSRIDNEVTYSNNTQDIFIDVLDSKQKILFLAHAPHPDISALRTSLTSNENYKIEVALSEDFSGNFTDYNLVIFHQLPNGGSKSVTQIENCLNAGIPSLFIAGSQTNYQAFNALDLGFEYLNTNEQLTEVNATVQPGFNLFKLSDNTQKMIKKMPPLHVAFGLFQNSSGVSSLINRRVGNIETESPLFAFNEYGQSKIALIGGEGIWRWKSFSFLDEQSHESFDELSTKMIQYLASKDDKSQFKVNSKNDFLENENIIFNGELYNEIYEPINTQDVNLVITNESNKEFTYGFSKTQDAYRLDAGKLPVGNYTYQASTSYNGKQMKEMGEFSIRPIFLEQVNTKADHRLLYNFAKENGGEMLTQNELSQIPQMLSANEVVHSTSYETKVLSDLINMKWILALLLVTLCAEWLVRKRNGTY